jgi:hypothetical protein
MSCLEVAQGVRAAVGYGKDVIDVDRVAFGNRIAAESAHAGVSLDDALA